MGIEYSDGILKIKTFLKLRQFIPGLILDIFFGYVGNMDFCLQV